MNNFANEIQIVINTLNTINVKGEENIQPLLGSIFQLRRIKMELQKAAEPAPEIKVEEAKPEE